MFRFINSVLDRIFVVLGVLILSQAPQFFSQYEHHLEGHLEEIKLHINQVKIAAEHTGKTLEQYILKFKHAKDIDYAFQGKYMHRMKEREKKLRNAFNSLKNASLFAKPFYFVYFLDPSVAKETMNSFVPGFLLNAEGVAYALLGIFLGFALFWLCNRCVIIISYLFKIPKNLSKKENI